MTDWNKKERIKTYDIDFVLNDFVSDNRNRIDKKKIIDGILVQANNPKFLTFKKSTKCANCGLKGDFFALEKDIGEKKNIYHFNLYGIKYDVEILMTVDHIVPKSRGGRNCIDNYQTLCFYCNMNKGDGLPKY